MYSQKDKQRRGSIFEQEFRASCNDIHCWVWKMRTAYQGTPFDYLLILENRNLGLELKAVKDPRLNYSAVRENQRIGLTAFDKAAKQNIAGLMVNWRDTSNEVNRCFFIPWYGVSDSVCGSAPGSIKLEAYKQYEIPRIRLENGRYGWHLRTLGRLIS